jgi:hypothetical protein
VNAGQELLPKDRELMINGVGRQGVAAEVDVHFLRFAFDIISQRVSVRCRGTWFPMRDFAETWGNASDHDAHDFVFKPRKIRPLFRAG